MRQKIEDFPLSSMTLGQGFREPIVEKDSKIEPKPKKSANEIVKKLGQNLLKKIEDQIG